MVTYKDTLVTIEHVGVTRDDTPILRDVCAEIRDVVRDDVPNQGQVVGLLGPSGIGKTTLLRVLAGLEAPTSGTVRIEGRATRAGSVGVVFQAYPLFDHRRVLANLTVMGAEDKARALLARFGLAARANAWPCELSGGERQRVAILQQLMCGHTYLVMDEPFSGLDPASKRSACALIADVARTSERTTIVVVTHDIREAVIVSDTLWLMGREPGSPGARIVSTYDLVARGLAWRPDLARDPAFGELVREIEDRFEALSGA